MKKSIVFFEAQGGSDKGPDGHRRDTMPMVEALKAKGWNADTIFYTDDKAEEIFDLVKEKYDGYVSRVNPGTIPGGESKYMETLEKLSEAGVKGFPRPKTMTGFGAKDSLVKLADTDLVPNDTYAYYDTKTLEEKFPISLSYGERVLKQNRGSTGEGIWRVQVEGDKLPEGQAYPLNTKLKCTEAVDNHVEYRELGDFMKFCHQYIEGENGQLVDMRFMPRIVEGEIRILMVGAKPIFVVHKKPAESADAFSATLFSGAKYTYDEPEKWQTLIDFFLKNLPTINEKLGNNEIPLIWTADFMLDNDKDGNDTYVLGEINCSCVGFTSHLDHGIQDVIADEIISSFS